MNRIDIPVPNASPAPNRALLITVDGSSRLRSPPPVLIQFFQRRVDEPERSWRPFAEIHQTQASPDFVDQRLNELHVRTIVRESGTHLVGEIPNPERPDRPLRKLRDLCHNFRGPSPLDPKIPVALHHRLLLVDP